jgi:hypothetical protein
MDVDTECNKKKISNIEQGMSKAEAIGQRKMTSSFEIPCSIFDIFSGRMACLWFSNYRPHSDESFPKMAFLRCFESEQPLQERLENIRMHR